jgi:hypothetical protein
MKTILKIAVIAISLVFLLMADLSFMSVPLVPEADAIFGVRRRMFRRGVIIGESAGAAAASQSAATSHQQAAPAQPQAAPSAPPAPPPVASGKPLPLGTVVAALPAGCVSTPVGGVDYFYCGGNFYRAVFQGNKLVYVTAKPE